VELPSAKTNRRRFDQSFRREKDLHCAPVSSSEKRTMTPASDRDIAADLAQRININRVDPSKEDEADRPPGDRPPAFADALMSEAPSSVERGAGLKSADWELIGKALAHYATCPNR
jgi:hypothetical protein